MALKANNSSLHNIKSVVAYLQNFYNQKPPKKNKVQYTE